ncbi:MULTISPECIES: tRNA 2-thiouridine(34) synthase MnmA [Herbidospora]|uniref:tRNA 2-thiouridine(34) synthase MnmA n=1 Tax=Herbidospora TaxID=28443 RepID=UPI0022A77F9A|nr:MULTISPECIES: tRNA 2-thiouridine(34) synthase MnmA [Herbidospora]GLX97540.1 tRNA-specific 2-thiouridylase MnmA [Herbidospora sp. NBRC 101105]
MGFKPLRVLAAMSGGVDSAVAAARIAEAGHDVTGVHLALSSNPQSYRTGARGCCTVEDSRDARRAADVIGIPFYIWDMAERFHRDVVEDFVAEYAAGRTPNPCLRCNEKIKFEAVLDRALALGFDAVATGHHARLEDGVLRRSPDEGKDQSYVLGVLTREQLSHAIFPLGDSTKAQVREEAARRGLTVADKPDSHDICFIADGDTRAFLADRLGEAEGPIVDALSGKVVGTHGGAFGYTVGQRKGLNIDRPAADGRPRYVLSIEPVSNTVTVGPRAALEVTSIVGTRPVWNGPVDTSAGEIGCLVQLRAHGEVYPARVRVGEGDVHITLETPATGVAPGQGAVLYDGDTVIGSATIASAA